VYEYGDYYRAKRVEEAAVKSNAQHYPIHNQVNSNAVKDAANNCATHKELLLTTQCIKDEAGYEGDKEVNYQAECSGSITTIV
jgi:hypothetical protein